MPILSLHCFLQENIGMYKDTFNNSNKNRALETCEKLEIDEKIAKEKRS